MLANRPTGASWTTNASVKKGETYRITTNITTSGVIIAKFRAFDI